MRLRTTIAIVLVVTVAIPALAQSTAQPPWQVRAYLSTYTDDGSGARTPTPSTSTWTWNMTAVRKQWVCPYCGYSTFWEDATPGDDVCPNPFGIASHPANVTLIKAGPKTRVLGYLDPLVADADNDLGHPLVGRPFHPGSRLQPNWNADPSPWEAPALEDVASYLTVRADNLDAGATPLVQNGYALRFLVLKPGSVRAAAAVDYVNASGAVVTTPAYYMVEGAAGTRGAEEYRIHVNPYRVSDGDVYYIRHYEERQMGVAGYETTGLEVQVYSTLYGSEFDSGGGITQAEMMNYDAQNGCRVITNSGALIIDIPRQYNADAAQTGTWLLKVVIRSTGRTMPSPDEVNYDSVYGTDMYTDPGETEPDFAGAGIGADMTTVKAPYVIVDTTRSPILATADAHDGVDYPVEEKVSNGDGFVNTPTANALEIWPYRMPPEAGGVGRVMVQWCELGSSPLQRYRPAAGGIDTFYYTGREWHYLADLTNYSQRLITNADVAQGNLISATTTQTSYLDERFMCSRLDVNLTGDEWVDSLGNNRGPTEADLEPATGGFPGIIIGQLLVPGPPNGYGGEFAPGARTPTREFTIANRTPAPITVCPVSDRGCGNRYLAADFPVGTRCPACGRRLRAGDGDADARYDAHTAPVASVAGARYWLTPEAIKFGPGVPVPMGALDFLQQVFVDVPPYQPPSVPAGATPYENDIANDGGYYGTMVAFHRPGEGDIEDRDFSWDIYFQSPNRGTKWGDPSETGSPADAERVCPVCDSRYSMVVASDGTCLFCGATLNPETPPVPPSALVAEEFDPFGLQVSVLRRAGLVADARVVDLGWVAPGVPATGPNTTNDSTEMVPGSVPMPADVSERADLLVRNEGNINLVGEMRSGYLFRADVDPAVRSYAGWAQTVPLTVETLFRYRPGGPTEADDVEFGPSAWSLWRQAATGAAGQLAIARVQAGIRSGGGVAYPNTIKPVPLGQPVGNYATDVILFVDLDGDGALDFYDAFAGVTSTLTDEFDPEVDEPFEPVASFATRLRVVESRLPQSDFYSKDVEPTLLIDPSRNNLQVLWASNRGAAGSPGALAPAGTSAADVPSPVDPYNILYANAALSLFPLDPLYRGWLWEPPAGDAEEASALTVSATPNESNDSATAYVDPATGRRWAMWHRSLTSSAGLSSQLRFDSSTSVDWDGSDVTEFLFGTSGAEEGLTGFVRPGAANEHWLFWHSGPEGREMIRYRPMFDPSSGMVPQDYELPVSNAARPGGVNFFLDGPDRYRKPAMSPFTFVRQPSAIGSYVGNQADPEFQVDVLFTGHIRALGNSDICWTRFNFGRPSDPNFPLMGIAQNYGKRPFPRVVNGGALDLPRVYDADGDLRGYAGEQLEPSPRRQAYQSRDIDWVVTDQVIDPADPAVPFRFERKPDWSGWLTDGTNRGLETYKDPKFYLGVVTESGGVRTETLYDIGWMNGSYDRGTGVYTVTPVLTGIGSGGAFDLPLNPGHPDNDHLGELIAPSVRAEVAAAGAFAAPGDYEDWPSVTLQISPASGTLNWSASLFNPDNPADPLAVFNTGNTPNLIDVTMYADYTPFVRRVTVDQANDDSPSAFYDLGGNSRLTVFWRRSYGDADTPHFGRPSFMHRVYTTALQVGRPPIAAGNIQEVFDLTVGRVLQRGPDWELASDRNGIIRIAENLGSLPDLPSSVGHRIRVTYTDAAGGTQVEQHRVLGWSLETPVPVNAVIAEGPLRVIPEIYTPAGANFDTVRYWLAWSSARPVFDLRAAGNNGQQVHQSSDIYLAVVAAEYSSLIADLPVPRLAP